MQRHGGEGVNVKIKAAPQMRGKRVSERNGVTVGRVSTGLSSELPLPSRERAGERGEES